MVRWGLLVLVLPLLVLMGVYFWELNSVRACQLDGGHWDYIESTCVQSPQPFVSWLQRSPLFVNGGLLISLVGLVMCTVGLYVKRAK